MTRPTLRDQIAADVYDLFLDADNRDEGFSEPVTYTPATDSDDGSERTIEVVIEADQTPLFDDDGNETVVERVKVFCERNLARGITNPLPSAKITRSSTYESDTRPYYYAGDQPTANIPGERTTNAWVLVFWRHKETARTAQQF